MVRSHTLKWKQKEAAELKILLDKNNVIAVADLTRFPASLFGEIRKKLAGKATVRVTKTRVALKALSESKFKDCGIDKFLKGSIAIMFTDLDPFQLYLLLKKCKGRTQAKAGMIADHNIIVPAGDTGLPPGPDLAVLKAADLQVQMKGSSIKISADKVVAKQGEKITVPVAAALAKLDIKPIEVALKVTAAVEGEQLYEAGVLDIDVDETIAKLVKAHQDSLGISVSIAFPNKANISILIAKSYKEAKNVALEAEYLCNETAPELLGKAKRQAEALGALAKPGGAPKEEKKEKPAEEKKEKAAVEKPAGEKKEEAAGKKEEKAAEKEAGKKPEGKKEEPKAAEEKKGEPAPKEGAAKE